MREFGDQFTAVHAESSKRARRMEKELDLGAATVIKQREAGSFALEEVTDGLRARLEEHAQESKSGAAQHVRETEGLSVDLEGVADQGMFSTTTC